MMTFAMILASVTDALPVVSKESAWLSANVSGVLTVLSTSVGAVFAAVAAYFGSKNHTLTTQIHVDTNGRLSALTTEVAELKAAANTALAVQTAVKAATDKAAVVAAAAASAAAAAAIVQAVHSPETEPPPADAQFTGTITGAVDEAGKLKADTIGTIKS